METILRGLSAGFIVGVVCVVYVLLRISRIQRQLEAEGVDTLNDEGLSNTWLLMAVFSSSSIVWGFLGAAIYYFVRNHVYFMLFSVCLAIIMTSILIFKNTRYKSDKIVLTLTITLGLGLLIPYLI